MDNDGFACGDIVKENGKIRVGQGLAPAVSKKQV